MRLTPAVVAAVLLLVPLSACSGDEPDPSPTVPSSSNPSETPDASPTSAAPSTARDLVVSPGRVGPAVVGMTQDEAIDTGLFDADVEFQGEACEGVDPLRWKDAFKGVDVLTTEDGEIVSMGIWDENGPRTEVGFGVGTTFGELIEGYGDQMTEPEPAGYGQVGVYVRQGDEWLGFLFGQATSVAELGNDHGQQVTFVEVTSGEKPALLRDGC